MSLTETEQFFEHYRDAFNRLDGDDVADLWHTPSSITDTRPGDDIARVTTWVDDAPMRRNMIALCEAYRAKGYGRADFEISGHFALGPNHAFTNVIWRLWHTDGSLLQEFRTGYQLLRSDRGLRVLVATAYEENIARMSPHVAG